MGMRSDAETMRRTDIDKELARRYRNDPFHIVLRCFIVEHSEQHLNRHCGQHTAIMRACTQCPKFPMIVKTCHRRLELLGRGAVPVVNVLCICDKGLHRSVAVATTLQAMRATYPVVRGCGALATCARIANRTRKRPR